MSNSQKLQDIIVLTEAAKVMESLANCRLAIPQSVRLGTSLLDIAKRLKAEIEDDLKFKMKVCPVGYGVSQELTRQQYADGAVSRFCQEQHIDDSILLQTVKDDIKANAGKFWDDLL